MSRWIARIVGVLLLIVFMMMFANMQRKLERLRDQQEPTTVRP
jgi:hypothetical protein